MVVVVVAIVVVVVVVIIVVAVVVGKLAGTERLFTSPRISPDGFTEVWMLTYMV